MNKRIIIFLLPEEVTDMQLQEALTTAFKEMRVKGNFAALNLENIDTRLELQTKFIKTVEDIVTSCGVSPISDQFQPKFWQLFYNKGLLTKELLQYVVEQAEKPENADYIMRGRRPVIHLCQTALSMM